MAEQNEIKWHTVVTVTNGTRRTLLQTSIIDGSGNPVLEDVPYTEKFQEPVFRVGINNDGSFEVIEGKHKGRYPTSAAIPFEDVRSGVLEIIDADGKKKGLPFWP